MIKIALLQVTLRGIILSGLLLVALSADAATLSLSPATGVYTSGQTFTVSVIVNTQGQPINAAEGTISFNPNELKVVSIGKGSLFNLWTSEPSFSNTAGTVSFSGGNPSGFKGAAGTAISITFRATGSGATKASLTSGAVLAHDGKGTNVLTSMNGGTYTISTPSAAPQEEVIIEYIPPANTPAAPSVSSRTHSDQQAWHSSKTAELSWSLGSGITGVRTLLDGAPTSIPSRVYDEPISKLNLPDLDEGISYFHVQLRNADGWGKVTHYRLAIDSIAPSEFVLSLPDGADTASPNQKLAYSVSEGGSKVKRFKIQIDGGEATEFVDEEDTKTITLPPLTPGYHTVVIEAFDEAGNSTIATISLTVVSFEKPTFTEYPDSIGTNVIPVIKGTTRPRSKVSVTFTQVGLGVSSADATKTYEVASDDSGHFVVIPDGRLSEGVYELRAVSVDESGAQSEPSDIIRIVVEEPGYLRIGAIAVSVLSVIVPLLALTGLLFFLIWFILARLRILKRGIARESLEAEHILVREFKELRSLLEAQRVVLASSRKAGKLTKSEHELIEEFTHALTESERRVMKEIEDVTNIVT